LPDGLIVVGDFDCVCGWGAHGGMDGEFSFRPRGAGVSRVREMSFSSGGIQR
jgi:hypothetical protein